MSDSDKKPFFVGYLDMPAQLKKYYLVLVIFLGIFAAAMGYSIASQQKSAGPATWQTASSETISGFLVLDPYPVLHRIDPQSDNQIESILLVNQGKHSAVDFAQQFDGQFVSVTGFPIRRGGWTMLELSMVGDITLDSNGIDKSNHSRLRSAAITKSLGPVTLSGEIADTKCFLGVMNPGVGSVHKACAEVCLLGGIPAMLLAWGDDGHKYGYMLTQSDGTSASAALANRAAERVEISGELEQRGNLLYIKMAGNAI